MHQTILLISWHCSDRKKILDQNNVGSKKHLGKRLIHPPDTLLNITDTFQTHPKHHPDTLQTITHTSYRHPRHRVEYNKSDGGGGWVGSFLLIIQHVWGSILQVGTCQNFSLAENSRFWTSLVSVLEDIFVFLCLCLLQDFPPNNIEYWKDWFNE